MLFNAIRQSDNIEILKLNYFLTNEWVVDTCFIKLLENSKTLTQLIIKCHQESLHDIVLIANSLKLNNSVKTFNYVNMNMDQTTTLKFLEQLKQAYTVEEVTLGVKGEASSDYQFLRDVEHYVQQINHIRSTNGVSSLLKVKIVHWDSRYNILINNVCHN